MNCQEGIRLVIDMSSSVCEPYVADLSDQDLMQRPHPGCNHLKWQLGHLISSEHQMINDSCTGSMPALPDGFAERYTRETASCDDSSKFDSKEVLMQTYREQRAGTLAALAKMSASDFDRPAPEQMRTYAPTIGACFSLIGSHWLMHCGQWVVVRRGLGHAAIF